MANNNETTTKFKVDITELKSQFQEAQRQIRLANSEFKAATSGMDKWSTSADGLSAKLKQLNSVYEAEKTKLSSLERQYEEVVKDQGENSRAAEELKIKINNQKAAVNSVESEIGKYNTKLKDLTSESENAADEQSNVKTATEKLNETISAQQSELDTLKTKYSDVILEQGNTSDEAKELSDKIQSLSTDLKENKDKLSDAEKAADDLDETFEDVEEGTKNADEGFTLLKGTLANLVSSGIQIAIGKLKQLASDTLDVGKTFDSSMSQVGAVSGAAGSELDLLRDKAKEMGANTKFSASEAADAFNYMAMAGWKTEDMIGGIDGVLNLAAASGTDLATTSDIVTDALTAMGYSAQDAGKLADVMAAASSNANTNVEMMGSTFKYVAPVAGSLGFSMEDTAVAIGAMANSGIKAESAGTALRAWLSRMAAPTKESKQAMDELGISMTNSDGTMKSLGEIMDETRAAFAGLSEEESAAAAKHLAGQQAMSGLLAIVNASPEDFEKLQNAVESSSGAAAQMAETMQNNLGGDMTKFQSKLEGTQIAIYEKFEPALRKGVEVLGSLLDKVNFVVEHSTEFSAAFSAIGAAVAAFLVIAAVNNFTAVVAAIKNMTLVTKLQTAAQWAWNTALNANPIGIVIMAVAALVAAFVVLWNKSEGFRNFWIGLWEKIKSAISAVVNWIKENWQTMLLFLTNPLAGVFKYCYEHFEGFRNFVDGVVTSVKDFFSNLWEGIKNVFSTIAQWVNENVFQPVISFFQPVIDFFTTAWEIISQLAEGCWILIKAVWSIVSAWFDENIIQPISNFFTSMWESVSKIASDAWEFIKRVWGAVSTWFKAKIIQPVSNFFSGMWNGLKTQASKAWEGIKSVFAPVANWFKNIFSKAWQKVKNVFSAGGKVFDGIKDGIASVFKTVVNAIIKGINKVIAVPFNAINSMLDKIRDVEVAGISPFEGLISRFDVPEIPQLAKGGIVSRATNVIVGENGKEAIMPLQNNTGWLDDLASRILVRAASKGGIGGSSLQNVTNNYNFNQTNNSPKSLSRAEIYRQSKNLLRGVQAV